ncbi:hypothetical protein [Paramuribaculum intestinale]|uniref:hypothetical protein n=1 Tax=Paramuribaculum intestinale TaxID=2094151 RepID=UPI00272B49F3|nr:hypothetical protein [Paramuribaculum intestinale]
MKRLILFPDVFIWEAPEKCVVYNSIERKGSIIQLDDGLSDLICHLQNPDSLYSIVLHDSLFRTKQIETFLSYILDSNSGCIVDDSPDLKLSLKPILRIQDDATYYKWQLRQGITEDAVNNLHSVILNVGSDYGDDLFAKQTLYPVKNSGENIVFRDVLDFFNRARGSDFLSDISIVGNCGGVMREDFLQQISTITNLNFYLNYEYIRSNPTILNTLSDYGKVTVLVRASCSLDDMSWFLPDLVKDISQIWILIESEKDYDVLCSFGSELLARNIVSVIPLFNGCNINFMHKALDIDVGELLANGPDKRQIFINQALNVFDFGKLYIMPSGLVYANLCNAPIGSIKDNISKLIISEFSKGTSWLKTRGEGKCRKCMFRFLCPSPSNYESLMNTSFCNIF